MIEINRVTKENFTKFLDNPFTPEAYNELREGVVKTAIIPRASDIAFVSLGGGYDGEGLQISLAEGFFVEVCNPHMLTHKEDEKKAVVGQEISPLDANLLRGLAEYIAKGDRPVGVGVVLFEVI